MKRTEVIELLAALQALEYETAELGPANPGEVARLRQSISQEMLQYYDRYMSRGKKAIAWVRHGVCAECHMQLSSGAYADLLRADDVATCEHCGRYLREAPPEPVARKTAGIAAS